MHRTNEALTVVNGFLGSTNRDTGGLVNSTHAILLASAGNREQALIKIQRAQELGQNHGHFHHTAYYIACAYALLNEAEPAMEWLKRSAGDGYSNYLWFERDPNLASLRGTPEFAAFLQRQKAKWEKLKASLTE